MTALIDADVAAAQVAEDLFDRHPFAVVHWYCAADERSKQGDACNAEKTRSVGIGEVNK